MPDPQDLKIKPENQPRPEDVSYDLDRALSSLIGLRSQIPADAFTARTLGTERAGNGVIISKDGLVLTVGYLITEAESVWLLDERGQATPAHVVAYDQETGFGLVQALDNLDLPHLELGSSADLPIGESVVVAGHGGRRMATKTKVVAKREFAGYWEYVLDEGIFTSPAHPNWGGTALIGPDGTLCGVGSLYVQQTRNNGPPEDGNLIVPIDLLKGIIGDMTKFGRVNKAPRPWLGMLTAEIDNRLVVAGINDGTPADKADIRVGDIVLGVAGQPVTQLAQMFRSIWSLGAAGVVVPLTVLREGGSVDINVQSASRRDFLKSPSLH